MDIQPLNFASVRYAVDRARRGVGRRSGVTSGRTDPGSQPRPWLVTDNLPTLGDAPVPLLAVDTAEDGGRGWAEDVAEAAAELRHGVLELTEQTHLTISRSRGSLELEKVSQHSFASSFPSRSMTITSAALACQYPRLFLLIGFYIVTY